MCQKITAAALMAITVVLGVAGVAPDPDNYDPPVRDRLLEQSQHVVSSASSGGRAVSVAGTARSASRAWASVTVAHPTHL
jgi:hypothetical protein